jgi:hypothetical protein
MSGRTPLENFSNKTVLENPVVFTSQKLKEITHSLNLSFALDICNFLMAENPC